MLFDIGFCVHLIMTVYRLDDARIGVLVVQLTMVVGMNTYTGKTHIDVEHGSFSYQNL